MGQTSKMDPIWMIRCSVVMVTQQNSLVPIESNWHWELMYCLVAIMVIGIIKHVAIIFWWDLKLQSLNNDVVTKLIFCFLKFLHGLSKFQIQIFKF